MGKLNQLDKAAEAKGKGVVALWQFIKFIVVSLGAFVIQLFLPYLLKLPMSEEFLSRPYEFLVFSSEKAASAGMDTTGLGLFIALTVSNILAQVFSFFVNKEKTFSVRGMLKVIFYAWASGETEGKLPRLLFSLPSGMDFRYSVSPRWAMPTPAIWPCFAISTARSFFTMELSESWYPVILPLSFTRPTIRFALEFVCGNWSDVFLTR